MLSWPARAERYVLSSKWLCEGRPPRGTEGHERRTLIVRFIVVMARCHYRILAREHRYGSRSRARGKCECSGARPRLTKRQRAAAVHNLTDFGRPSNRAKRLGVRAPLRRFGRARGRPSCSSCPFVVEIRFLGDILQATMCRIRRMGGGDPPLVVFRGWPPPAYGVISALLAALAGV
jgi:hypothetical protein